MIVNEILPVIEVNFEEVKQSMSEVLEQYSGYLVTEDNLKSCKETQKQLASVRVSIDKYRKTEKTKLSAPIAAFEDKCKELIALVEAAEVPIKEGIKVFDDMKREAKMQVAKDAIQTAIESRSLVLKYATKLTVIEKYLNLTATVKDVTEDIEARADALLNEQKNEEAMLEVIHVSIDNANNGINAKLSIDDFKRSIDNGVSAKDIISDINTRAERIRVSEMPKPEPVVISEVETTTPIVQTAEPVQEAKKETTFIFEVRMTATESQLRALKQFLTIQNIAYEKISLEEV